MKGILKTEIRILTFRASREELLALDNRHLAFGLLCTWLVGMGRWWDDPGARLFQHLGVGSLAYVFVLSLLLWLLIWPLRQNWSYCRLLTYIALTSPPAALYAIPVERWWGMESATSLNVLFLAVVAIWRIALLAVYLTRLARLEPFSAGIGVVLPIMLIVFTLGVLNLERAVFQVMAGLHQPPPTSADGAFLVVYLLAMLSTVGIIPVGFAYCVLIALARRRASPRTGGEETTEAASELTPE